MWYYGGLNENNSHWFIGSGTIGRYRLVGGRVSLGAGFGISEIQSKPVTHCIFLLPVDQR